MQKERKENMKVSNTRMFLRSKVFQLLVLSIVVFGITTIVSPGWVNQPNLRRVLDNTIVTGIFLCAVAPLLMSGVIDFSGTATAVFSQVAFIMIFDATGLPWGIVIIIAIIIGAAIGFVNSLLVVRLNLMAFIATMAMATVIGGIASWLSRNVIMPMTATELGQLSTIWFAGIIPLFFIVFLALIIIYSFILMKTTFGRSVLMCGGNQVAARLAGLNPKKIRTILFINSGAVASLVGVIHAAQNRSANAGTGGLNLSMPHMTAFIASILGGVSFFGGSGSLAGAFMGVILLELLSYSVLVMLLPAPITHFINGALLIIALTVDQVSLRMRMKKLGLKGGGSGGPVMPGVAQR